VPSCGFLYDRSEIQRAKRIRYNETWQGMEIFIVLASPVCAITATENWGLSWWWLLVTIPSFLAVALGLCKFFRYISYG